MIRVTPEFAHLRTHASTSARYSGAVGALSTTGGPHNITSFTTTSPFGTSEFFLQPYRALARYVNIVAAAQMLRRRVDPVGSFRYR